MMKNTVKNGGMLLWGKLLPLIVRVVAGPPASTRTGDRLPIKGIGVVVTVRGRAVDSPPLSCRASC